MNNLLILLGAWRWHQPDANRNVQPTTVQHCLTSHIIRASTTARRKAKNSTFFQNAIRHTTLLGTTSNGCQLLHSKRSVTSCPSDHPVLYLIFPFVLLVFLVSNFHCSIFFYPSDFATSHVCSCWIMHRSCLASYQAGEVRDQ